MNKLHEHTKNEFQSRWEHRRNLVGLLLIVLGSLSWVVFMGWEIAIQPLPYEVHAPPAPEIQEDPDLAGFNLCLVGQEYVSEKTGLFFRCGLEGGGWAFSYSVGSTFNTRLFGGTMGTADFRIDGDTTGTLSIDDSGGTVTIVTETGGWTDFTEPLETSQ